MPRDIFKYKNQRHFSSALSDQIVYRSQQEATQRGFRKLCDRDPFSYLPGNPLNATIVGEKRGRKGEGEREREQKPKITAAEEETRG